MNAAEKKRLTGRIAAEHIKLMETPRPPQGAVERFKALGDPSGIISDTMDELGIPSGVIGASVLRVTRGAPPPYMDVKGMVWVIAVGQSLVVLAR